jgi:hypothetical protein
VSGSIRRISEMGIGVSIFLIAVGAILAFAVNVTTQGVNLATIGVILMIVGGIGLLTALVIGGVGSWGGVHRTAVVDEGYVDGRPVARRRTLRRDTYVD